MKARQSARIRELGDALVTEGFFTLDEKAKALGLCRSTTWTILKANHKSSGLSATIINRLLRAPQLPPLVRATLLEYVEERAAGLYGHSKAQRRRFAARLPVAHVAHAQTKPHAKRHETEKTVPLVPSLLAAFADELIE